MSTDHPQARADLDVVILSHEARLTDPETGQIHLLNPSAFAIWELCDGSTPVDAMAEAVVELTEMDGAEATRQVRDTIATLREKGLVL